MTVTDSPDWMSPGQQVSAMIASGSVAGTPGGTPLLHGYQLITNNTTWTAGAASSFFSSRFTIQGPAYQFAIQSTVSSASATLPFARIVLSFFTAASGGVKVDEVDFYIPCTSSGAYWIYGGGPALTPYVSVQVQNLDPTFTLSGQFVLGSSTLQKNRHDWRGFQGGTVPGYTFPPNQNMSALLLASTSTGGIVISALSSVTYLLPLYSGQAQLSAQLTVTPNPGVQYSIGLPEFAAVPPVFELNTVSTTLTSQIFILPRAITTLTITNNNGVASIGFALGITGLEYAS